jgi:hypothetical protein
MTEEIILRVDLPEVVETPVRIEVRCGEIAVYVHEHGMQGSGSWAAWLSSGHTIGEQGRKYLPSIDQALEMAREYVRDRERSRRAHAQLTVKLVSKE